MAIPPKKKPGETTQPNPVPAHGRHASIGPRHRYLVPPPEAPRGLAHPALDFGRVTESSPDFHALTRRQTRHLTHHLVLSAVVPALFVFSLLRRTSCVNSSCRCCSCCCCCCDSCSFFITQLLRQREEGSWRSRAYP